MADTRSDTRRGLALGRKIAPPRFIAFILIALAGGFVGISSLGWREGVMAGFDVAALIFLASCTPLLNDKASEMREAARRNDANRLVLLGITGLVVTVILVAVALELSGSSKPDAASIALIIVTLALAWIFSNFIYALHYAHLFYAEGDDGDHGGITVPDTGEPDYWDFVYFAFTLGMTFQTSDVEIGSRLIRRVVIFHCLAAFVFNIGVLAFSINVLGGKG